MQTKKKKEETIHNNAIENPDQLNLIKPKMNIPQNAKNHLFSQSENTPPYIPSSFFLAWWRPKYQILETASGE